MEKRKTNPKTSEAGNARLANNKTVMRKAHTKPPLTPLPLCAAE